ncbi:putative squalene synthase [Ceratocystis fimbriata CBS 114723]|uniref:Squalene synthase n=1 Tax=Ceratocystis fimbriata CBS 114723 TaxID=1035309 RepID=A0A2C5WVF1_9PEZI|nr:putative squalene synthase [Ceratocystis fimbriata CBS 114723]
MGKLYYLFHPNQLRSIIQWKLWHDPVHRRDPSKESPTLQSCFKFLDLTSRSFAAVIKELNPELLVPVALFYLILRGLDTVEDDMTIPIATKEPILRTFWQILEKDGWTFSDNGPNEKDRELLVHFDDIIHEYKLVKPEYREIITDITKKMGNGMADYALNAEHNINGVATIPEYEKYCHYVAGLVGEGLTRLFVTADFANRVLLDRPQLTESMGQFLQKTNIIRDVREDFDDKRRFWPKEIWGKHFEKWDDLFDPKNLEKAIWVSSEMVLNALGNLEDCLYYMSAVKDQSVFNFVAIPQSMAIATLELVFRNPEIFNRNIKISKGDACQLMTESTQDLRTLYGAFRRYVRKIHHKNDPRDPCYVKISTACARIEQVIETIFPSQTLKSTKTASSSNDGLIFMVTVVGMTVVLGLIMVAFAFGFSIILGKYFPDTTASLHDVVSSATKAVTSTASAIKEEL